jgi:hypothetical protein
MLVSKMRQERRQSPVVVFDTSLDGIGHVLALAMAAAMQSKGEIRMTSLSVSRNNLKAASFCELMERFYGVSLSVGMWEKGTAETTLPPMMSAVLAKPTYNRTIEKLTDTADPVALIRNALTAQQDGLITVVTAGSPVNLLGLLALPEGAQLVQKKVRTLIIAGTADAKLLEQWPSPVVIVGEGVGRSLAFPAASIEQDFAWAPNHPLVDAYRAAETMPYDAPSAAMAALYYAAHPEDKGFIVAGAGKQKQLAFDAEQRDRVIQVFRQTISAKPPEPRGRGRGGQE